MKQKMELHSPAMAKKLWNFLRVAYFMMRKGLISKRKLIMDMNLMMKRGKLLGKTLRKNIIHHHHTRSVPQPPYGFPGVGLQEYEFSCSNSPNPVFFHAGKRKPLHYFPCISAIVDDDNSVVAETPRAGPVILLPQIEYSPQCPYELSAGERLSPLPSSSPFSVRVSNYSSDDEISEDRPQVDDEAEEFIRMFYEQLRSQSRMQLLQYQEMEYQEMLARGTR